MTNRDAIYEYRQFVESITGDTSDDTISSELAIYNTLRTSRSVVLHIAVDRGEKLSEEHFQTLTCIELEEVDRVECPFIPASGCVWLRSTCEIPNFISVQSVSTQLGDSYSYVRWDKVSGKVGGRLKSSQKEKFYSLRTIKDKVYLYIYNDNFIKNITLTAIFEDPIKASAFCGYDNTAICNPMDTSFHTAQHLVDLIKKNAWDVMLRARAAAKLKVLNNDSQIDTTTEVPRTK